MKPLAVLGSLLLFAASERPVADFRNIAPQAGLTAAFPNGGTTSKQFIIETTGSGVALIDYDNDGLLDIFVVSGKGGTNRLYHNDGHDRFTRRDRRNGPRVQRLGTGRLRRRLRQ